MPSVHTPWCTYCHSCAMVPTPWCRCCAARAIVLVLWCPSRSACDPHAVIPGARHAAWNCPPFPCAGRVAPPLVTRPWVAQCIPLCLQGGRHLAVLLILAWRAQHHTGHPSIHPRWALGWSRGLLCLGFPSQQTLPCLEGWFGGGPVPATPRCQQHPDVGGSSPGCGALQARAGRAPRTGSAARFPAGNALRTALSVVLQHVSASQPGK